MKYGTSIEGTQKEIIILTTTHMCVHVDMVRTCCRVLAYLAAKVSARAVEASRFCFKVAAPAGPARVPLWN